MHKGDLTGIEIINRLMEQVWPAVEQLQEASRAGLIPTKDGDALAGVLMIDMRTGRFRFVRAKAVLMATGGGPTMYKLSHAVGRQDHGRPGDGAAARLAAARHGNGAVPSHRPARRSTHA